MRAKNWLSALVLAWPLASAAENAEQGIDTSLVAPGLGTLLAHPEPPIEVQAFDTPNDDGGSITLTWPRDRQISENAMYQVTIADSPSGPFRVVAEVAATKNLMSEAPALFGRGADLENHHYVNVEEFAGAGGKTPLEDGKTYYFHIDVRSAGGAIRGKVIVNAESKGNFFNRAKVNNLVLCLVFSGLIMGYIGIARRRELKIRRIAGLEALDEALGRATEMGKPVLFIHGLRGMEPDTDHCRGQYLGAGRAAHGRIRHRAAGGGPRPSGYVCESGDGESLVCRGGTARRFQSRPRLRRQHRAVQLCGGSRGHHGPRPPGGSHYDGIFLR